MYKNMKIEINEEQPIDEVLKELDRLGYLEEWRTGENVSCIAVFEDGSYHIYKGRMNTIFSSDVYHVLTTIAELKEM